MPAGPRYRGWKWNETDSTLDVYIGETKVAAFGASAIALAKATSVTGVITGSTTIKSSGLNYQKGTQTLLTSGATVTLTAAQVLTGYISDTITAGCAMTLPLAAGLIAAMPQATIGTSFILVIHNTAASAITITVTTNTGNTLHGAAHTIAQGLIGVYTVLVSAADAVRYIRIGDSA